MREKSHQKGKDFLKGIKSWLIRTKLMGYDVEPFGDTYDISRVAVKIGGEYFDMSFKLQHNESVKKIAYIECKYRDETSGNINRQFKDFIETVYKALTNCDGTDEKNNSEFFFISNIPPDDWRKFLNKRKDYIEETLTSFQVDAINEDVLQIMGISFHILVLSEKIIFG